MQGTYLVGQNVTHGLESASVVDSEDAKRVIRFQTYGARGSTVVVLHGGPGAAGEMAPVARELAQSFRVLEPWQRRSGTVRLTVARHVADLHELLRAERLPGRPALVGSSWGAMLALAYGAAHPSRVGPVVLVGCGTFDPAARAKLMATLGRRMTPKTRSRLEAISGRLSDPDDALKAEAQIVLPRYSFDPIKTRAGRSPVDARGARETWADMLRLQADGTYPASFRRIRSPVLMLHGSYDPHPGRMILAGLRPYLPQIEYREWKRCGHFPWLEREVREEFYSVLREWLSFQLSPRRDAAREPSVLRVNGRRAARH